MGVFCIFLYLFVFWVFRADIVVLSPCPPQEQHQPKHHTFFRALFLRPTRDAATQDRLADRGTKSPFASNEKSNHVWLTDEGAARLRHLYARLRLSDTNITLGLELFSRFFTGQPADELTSRTTWVRREMRLDDADMHFLSVMFAVSAGDFSIMSDDSNKKSLNKHCLFVNFTDESSKTREIRTKLVSTTSSVSKTAIGNAVTNLTVLESKLDTRRVAGGTGDNANGAQAEYRETLKIIDRRETMARRIQILWLRHVLSSAGLCPSSLLRRRCVVRLAVVASLATRKARKATLAFVVGDLIHKDALIAKYFRHAAFGASHGMHSVHHLQACYIWWYLTDKDPLVVAQHARDYMDGNDGIWTQKGSPQQEQRWQVDAKCAARFLELMDSKKGSTGDTFLPSFARKMMRLTDPQGYKHSMWKELAQMTTIGEVRVGLEWEGEFDATYFSENINWARSQGPFYVETSFRLNELPHHIIHDVFPFFARLFKDLDGVLPKTVKALARVEEPKRGVMRALLLEGACASYLEVEKLHEQTFTSPISLMLLCSPTYGPAASRALASILSLEVEQFSAAPPTTNQDALFLALYERDGNLAAWFAQLGFGAAS